MYTACMQLVQALQQMTGPLINRVMQLRLAFAADARMYVIQYAIVLMQCGKLAMVQPMQCGKLAMVQHMQVHT